MSVENSLTTLLRLTDAFLSGNGFQKTATQLQKEAKKRGIPLSDEKPEATLPSLDSVFTHWQATHSLNETEGSASDDESSVLSESDDSSDDSSEDDSSSDDEEEQVKPEKKRGTKRKRGQASVSSSASSSASDSSASSDSDSSSSDSSSDSTSDADSDSDAESVEKAAVATPKAAKVAASSSDSDSGSDSDSDSSSDSGSSDSESSADEPQETALTTPQAVSRHSSSASSATIAGTPVASGTLKRKLSSDEDEDGSSARKLKKTNEPFSRIPKDQWVDPKLASNKFVPYDYAQRAHEKLIITKGKGFTKEKNKGKRGSYRGGKIDFTPKGIKFED